MVNVFYSRKNYFYLEKKVFFRENKVFKLLRKNYPYRPTFERRSYNTNFKNCHFFYFHITCRIISNFSSDWNFSKKFLGTKKSNSVMEKKIDAKRTMGKKFFLHVLFHQTVKFLLCPFETKTMWNFRSLRHCAKPEIHLPQMLCKTDRGVKFLLRIIQMSQIERILFWKLLFNKSP